MILFVAGIDTGIGKTVATGLMARWYAARGVRVVTQKLVQTGCAGLSEDIMSHRRLMGVDLLPADRSGLTCPYVFKFSGSPHLAASLAGRRVNTRRLESAARALARQYEIVLVEGVGGLHVPLTGRTTALDFVARCNWPVVLVTAPRLGSINHTLLSLEALRARRLALTAVLYNLHRAAEPEITTDTRRVIRKAIRAMGYSAPVLDIPFMAEESSPGPRFTGLPGAMRLAPS